MLPTLRALIQRRLFWLLLLLTVWLFCSGQAQAEGLAQRLQRFPDWQSKPTLEVATGDLVYPDWLQGTWTLTSTLVEVAAPLAPTITSPGFAANQDWFHQPVHCQVRFVAMPQPVQGLLPVSTGVSKTVADRAFNGLNLLRAYLGEEAVQRVRVDPQNPNRQITWFRQQRQLESTVSARATETPNASTFVASELVQQVFRGTAQPFLNQVEITTAYTRIQERVIADQVTAVYLSPQDPDYFKARAQPVALYRYQLELDPVTGID